MPIPPADFDAIFTEGARFPWPSGDTLRVELREAAELLPTGRLVARDNGMGISGPEDETQAFAHTVKEGGYAVVLAIARFETASYGARPRAAAAKVVISG
ncbi:DUF4241 domain-containing protein [Nonomuraea insulae]|uniref:DUF4241 domain-containing protein n=1 Tax=Nonomuraea insulae TaxID=1616787 RepID=A0ABW1CB44_9ACTN